ncbi:MAG: pirin family protein [Granulosicoccus sp.]
MSIRPVKAESKAKPTMEGAGVHLHRVFGFGDTTQTDPFLMMDDFRNDDPAHYSAGFPWHPHRGIETITYVLAGSVEHADSLGNSGLLGAGSVQWMTAGSGILHQEMPKGDAAGRMHGFQLWANLPASMKMSSPRYQDIAGNEITELYEDDGTIIRIVVGSWRGKKGPVDGIAADPQYLDISVPANTRKVIPIDAYRNAFAYVFQGSASFRNASDPMGIKVEKEIDGEEVFLRDRSGNRTLVLFDTGDEIAVETRDEPARFLLISGKAIKEPVAWHGPIVMNTQQEIRQALKDLNDGSFIKESARG